MYFLRVAQFMWGISVFFDRLKLLCEEKSVSVYKACTDIGLNRSAVNKWKAGGSPRGSVVAKFADYFGVSTDYLLGNEKSAQAAEGEDADTIDFSNLRNADGTPVSDEKMKIIMRILSMGLEDTRNLNKWIDFMDELNREKK